MAGWWICTAIKMAPATAALMPAARVSLEGVIDMAGLLRPERGGFRRCCGRYEGMW